MTQDINSFVRSERHLPDFMRDFHAQKQLFKAMHASINPNPHDLIKRPNWVEGQCYVIDVFLKFMAKHGYTLQRNRSDVSFLTLEETLSDYESKFLKLFDPLPRAVPNETV